MLQQAFGTAFSISLHHIQHTLLSFVTNLRLIGLLELGYVLLINGSVGLAHSVDAAPKHFSWRRLRSRAVLLVHILAGTSEVLRWHVRALYQHLPEADGLDVLLCLAQSATNLALVKWMCRGYPIMTRPTYQAGGLLRPTLTLLSYILSAPSLHRASIKALNAFGYARLLIHFLGPLIKSKHSDSAFAKQKYNVAIFASAVLAIAESRFQYAVPFYTALVVGVAWVNRWSTVELARRRVRAGAQLSLVEKEEVEEDERWRRRALIVCAWIGFMELEGLRALPDAEEKRPYDEYADDEGVKKL